MFRNFDAQKRSHESPMDFEWQTQAPMDPTSPFAQSRPLKSAFDSQPPKNSFISASSTPAPQFRNPSFTTPRKPFEPELFSEQSGIESSPGEVGDAEDTPDPPQSSQAMTAFSNGGTIRQPIFGKYGAGFQGPSPGHREQRRGKYGNAIVQKMRKRKRLERDYGLSREMQQYDSESDDDGSRPKSRGGGKRDKSEPPANPSPGLIAGFFNYIEAHPHLPNILSYYAQMTVNFFVVFLGIYAVYSMWMTIRADVDKASEGERAMLIAEMAKCAKDFVNNGCAKAGKAPALEIPCNEWEHCMNQDPASVGRARISAHTFADILNSFIEPISWKAMIFVAMIITLFLVVNNFAFGQFRSKHQADFHNPNFHPSAQQLFPQPSQNFHWGAIEEPRQFPSTPRHNQDQYGGTGYGGNMIMPSGTPGMGMRTPSRGHGDRERSMSPRKNRSPSKGY